MERRRQAVLLALPAALALLVFFLIPMASDGEDQRVC